MEFWLNLLQAERRVDLQGTLQEMAETSAIIYCIPALTLLAAMFFPAWEGLHSELMYAVIAVALSAAGVFYLSRRNVPLWLSISHVPLGIMLVGVGMYAAGGDVGVIVSAVFVLSSLYAYHFFTLLAGGILIFFSAFVFAFVARLLDIEQWPFLTVLTLGFSYTAGIVVHLLVKRIHKLATIDPLTMLYNRQTWDMLLAQQLALAERTGESFQLMMIDLNDFKKINDRNGHLYGDKILHKVGLALKKSVRLIDHVARWGGDEFIILFPQAEESVLNMIKGRLQRELNGIISFSIGSTSWQPGDTADTLLLRADTALYADKQLKKMSEIIGDSDSAGNLV